MKGDLQDTLEKNKNHFPVGGYVLNIERIVSELKNDRDRINQVIALLEGTGSPSRRTRRGPARRAAAPQKTGSRLTPEGRKKLSDMMKKRWAERRRLKKSGR
ncbi:MAG: hypothetical protein ACRD3T_02900 [Terriglobia bacterium]